MTTFGAGATQSARVLQAPRVVEWASGMSKASVKPQSLAARSAIGSVALHEGSTVSS